MDKFKFDNLSEVYTVGFDMSGGKDETVAVVCKVVGSTYQYVNTCTGEEAEWMYSRITNRRI